jgi:hypothetical protein
MKFIKYTRSRLCPWSSPRSDEDIRLCSKNPITNYAVGASHLLGRRIVWWAFPISASSSPSITRTQVQLHHMVHLSSTDVGTNPQIPQHRTLRLTISIEPPLVDTIANRSKTPECERNPRFRSRAAKAVGAAPWMAVSGLHMKGVNEEGFATGSGMRTDGFGDGQSSNRFRVLS